MFDLEQCKDLNIPVPFPGVVMEEPCWYAIQTRGRHEKKVATQLRNKGIETFLPLTTETHRWSDRNKKIQLPLFPCYAFLRLSSYPHQHLMVLQTPGVVGFAGIGGVGLPIPDKEIDDLQALLTHYVACELYPFLKLGQRVRIRGGCLDGVEGILVGKNGDRSLIISIEMIQRSVAVCIEGYDLEPV